MHSTHFHGAAAVLLLALSVAPGCGKKATADTTVAVSQPVHVETVQVGEQAMPRTLALTGTLRGQRQTDLAANAMGRVLETFVERGAEVKRGDRLATLDVRFASLSSSEAQAHAALARAQLGTAQRECERNKVLLAKGTITQAEHDRTADQCQSSPLSVAAADARALSAAQSVGDGQIRAPFDGIIGERFIEVGQYVRQDTKVVSLVSIDRLRLELTVPEANVAAVTPGGLLTFTVPAHPERTFTGTLRHIGVSVRETTRDLVVEAEVDNADRALRPGMFAAVSLSIGEASSPVVPKDTLVAREARTHVFAVVGGRVEERVVQLGAARGELVAVTRGLRKGDTLVRSPAPTLKNGQAVD